LGVVVELLGPTRVQLLVVLVVEEMEEMREQPQQGQVAHLARGMLAVMVRVTIQLVVEVEQAQ
jgi:hypothetical protein